MADRGKRVVGIMALAFALAACSSGIKGGNEKNPFGDPTAGSGDDTAASGSTGVTPAEDTDAISASDSNSVTGSSTGECGNGVIDGDEQCDGEDFGAQDCAGSGFQGGVLVCTQDCAVVTDACFSCGDGDLALTEACDGQDFGGETCQSLGYGGGTLACGPDCATVDTSGCTPLASCGDNTRNGTEECDGADLGGSSCTSLGFDQGNLGCNAGSCTFNTQQCSYLNCAGQDEFCLFDQDDPQSNCCPPGVGGNVVGICVGFVCQ